MFYFSFKMIFNKYNCIEFCIYIVYSHKIYRNTYLRSVIIVISDKGI